jgi:hypothetical protein
LAAEFVPAKLNAPCTAHASHVILNFAISLNGEFPMPFCDGCGAQVDEAHIRRRIERLELATRFRPIHIQVLLLDGAPPLASEDYFYRATSSTPRSAQSQVFFDEIAKSIGLQPSQVQHDDATLAEFQRRGFYLAYAVECPVESAELPAAVARLARTVLLRLNASYKPKFVAPVSAVLQPVVSLLQNNSWADRLILQENRPFDQPGGGMAAQQAAFGAALADRLSQALAHHS